MLLGAQGPVLGCVLPLLLSHASVAAYAVSARLTYTLGI
jgi:hypothetical protein